MKSEQRLLGGTTLVELLVAVVFIGVCVSSILACVTTSGTRAIYARRRMLMLAQARSEIEKTKAQGRTASLTAANTTTSAVVPGFTGTASMAKSVALVTGYTNLYRITVSITWTERGVGTSRSDSLSLETWTRSPDA